MLYTLCNGIKIPLSKEKVILLSKFYNRWQLSQSERNEVERYLQSKYQLGKQELACDCMRVTIVNGTNSYTMRSVGERQHAPECELESRDYNYVPDGPRIRPDNHIVDLMQGTGKRTPSTGNAGNSGNSGTGQRRQHRILAALYALLDNACVHTINSTGRSYKQTVSAIKNAAKIMRIPAGLHLSDILHVGDYSYKAILNALKQEPKGWPEGSLWHQIQVMPCDKFKVENGVFKLTSQSYQTSIYNPDKVRLRKPGNLSQKKEGPFLFIFVFTKHKKKDGEVTTRLAQAGVIYIDTKSNFLPLESEFERAMCWGLKKVLSERLDHWKITKPVFDDEFGVRPDFLIQGHNLKPFVLEVAGIDNDEYRERKAETHRVMREKYAHVQEFIAYEHADNPFKGAIEWLRRPELLDRLR